MLRNVTPDDALSIAEIYNYYILNSPATFEEVPVTADEMRQRIVETTQSYPWFVCEEDGRLLGYAYGRKWRDRAAYRHSVEAGVYLHPSAVGKRIGSSLLDALLTELRARQAILAMAFVLSSSLIDVYVVLGTGDCYRRRSQACCCTRAG